MKLLARISIIILIFLPANSYIFAQEKPSSIHLRLGKIYAENGDWQKSESEYVKALEVGDDAEKKEALEALSQVLLNKRKAQIDQQQKYIETGERLEEQDRFKDAETAFDKALNIDGDPELQNKAFDSLKRVISEQEGGAAKYFRNWILPIIWKSAISVAALICLVVLIFLAGSMTAGLNKSIEVSELADTSDKKLGSRFKERLVAVNDQIIESHTATQNLLLSSEKQTFPVMLRSGDMIEMPNISAKLGPVELTILAKFIKYFFWNPKYRITGSVHLKGARALFLMNVLERRSLFAILKRPLHGRYLLRKTWEKTFELENQYFSFELEKYFAYEIIFFFIGELYYVPDGN